MLPRGTTLGTEQPSGISPGAELMLVNAVAPRSTSSRSCLKITHLFRCLALATAPQPQYPPHFLHHLPAITEEISCLFMGNNLDLCLSHLMTFPYPGFAPAVCCRRRTPRFHLDWYRTCHSSFCVATPPPHRRKHNARGFKLTKVLHQRLFMSLRATSAS